MWYNYPIRKEYEISFTVNAVFKWKEVEKKFTLFYKQATILDTLEFLKVLEDDSVTQRLLEFVEKQWELDKFTLWLIKIDSKLLQTIFNTVKDTMFSWVFWTGGEKSSEKQQPYSSALVFLCEKICVWPDEFQKKYTIEQMMFLMEWVIYNINAQTEEWQVENERIEFNKENSDEDLLELIS